MTKQSSRKAPPAPAATPEVSRKHHRLREEQQRKQRILIAIVGVVLGLVLIILAAGLVNEYVVKPRRPIATVNGEVLGTSAFQRRLRFAQDNLISQINQYVEFGQQFASQGGENPFMQAIQGLYDQLSAPETLSLNVLDDMIETALVKQLAANQGVTVTDDEVQQEIEKDFGYARNPTPTPTPDPAITGTVPGPTPVSLDAYQKNYGDTIKGLADRNSLNEAEFRDLYVSRLLRQKLQEVAPLDVQDTEKQIKARHILINFPEVTEGTTQEQVDAETLEKIKAIRERIVKGEAFVDVAKEVSDDTGSKESGGDLGWFGKGRMVAEFENAAFSQTPGVLGDPVKTQYGYHLILVEEKDPARKVDETELTQRRDTAFTTWLTTQKDAATIQRNWSASAVPAMPSDVRDVLASLTGVLFQPTPAAATTPAAPGGTPVPASTLAPASTPAAQ